MQIFKFTINPYSNVMASHVYGHAHLLLKNHTLQINATAGVVGHGLFEKKEGLTAVVVAGDRGIRIAGKDGEVPWWEDNRSKKAIDRLRVDNRQPEK